ncbi:MAG: hypothetical protein HY720_04790 [Planctomycetes bacterium]|nr:hypothetical protein [Planctomycetota bacterium]
MEPVLTSKSSHIGEHRIVKELGVVKTKKTALMGSAYSSEAEALADLKAETRRMGANGIINMTASHSHWTGKCDGLSGLAVILEPLAGS